MTPCSGRWAGDEAFSFGEQERPRPPSLERPGSLLAFDVPLDNVAFRKEAMPSLRLPATADYDGNGDSVMREGPGRAAATHNFKGAVALLLPAYRD